MIRSNPDAVTEEGMRISRLQLGHAHQHDSNKDVTMKVVHFVHAYLHTTQNWCYQLIKNLSSVKLIVSEQILNEGSFPLSDARFIIALFA